MTEQGLFSAATEAVPYKELAVATQALKSAPLAIAESATPEGGLAS